MRRRFAHLLVACTLALAGCGSVKNVTRESDVRVFGGTRMSCVTWIGGHSQNAGLVALAVAPFWLADKPLCLVGDAVTLPFVLAYQWVHPDCRKQDPFWDLFRLDVFTLADARHPKAQEVNAADAAALPGSQPPVTPGSP